MAFKYTKRASTRAKRTPGKSYVARGKAPKLGTGKRFAALTKAIGKRKGVKDPAAIAAFIGRRKYSPKKMATWAAAGRKRRK